MDFFNTKQINFIKTYRQVWLHNILYNPLYNFNKWNSQEHGLHIIKKQTICSVMTSLYIGLLPIFIYVFPLYSEVYSYYFLYFMLIFYSVYLWFYSIIWESEVGSHTFIVQRGLVMGFILFLLSEVMFFFSIFWAFFYFSLDASVGVGCQWPPYGIATWDIYTLPTLNTVILLYSGISVTYCHQALLLGKRFESLVTLAFTICLGLIFTVCQVFEYIHLSLTINDSVFGSIFYLSTGFHGLHVLIGTLFLLICFFEHYNYRVLLDQHIGLECAIWYWHFVDVIWLFLFVFIYCLGK